MILERKVVQALTRGSTDDVRLFLEEEGPELTKHTNLDGESPLHIAVSTGNLELTRLLINQGALPNHPNNEDQTPVHYASHLGHGEILDLLLSNGGSAYNKDEDGNTALHFAVEGKAPVRMLQLLIKHGSTNVNVMNDDFETPLHIAVTKDKSRSDAVEFLLEHGADLTLKDSNRETAFDMAMDASVKAILRKYQATQVTRDNLELLVPPQNGSSKGRAQLNQTHHEGLSPVEELDAKLDELTNQQESYLEFIQEQFSTLYQQNRARKSDLNSLRNSIQSQHDEIKLELERLTEVSDNCFCSASPAETHMSCPHHMDAVQKKDRLGETALDVKMKHIIAHCVAIEFTLLLVVLSYIWNRSQSKRRA